MAIKLIQLTDCHLLGDPDGVYKGVNPLHTLRRVCTRIAGVHRDADALLLTGDLSQDESAESYALLADTLKPLGLPAYAIPGNHDDPARMQAVPAQAIDLDRDLDFGAWRVLTADSRLPGRVEGELSDHEIDRLEAAVRADNRPCLVAIHHHPLPVGSAWMDRIGLRNGERLIALARRYRQLRCIVHGHTHQAGCVFAEDLPVYGTPSTWRQFVAGSRSYGIDTLPPALRVIRLDNDGTHSSWVEFVQTAG